MNSELFNALDLLEREKGISKAYMMEKLEAALTNAYKRERGGYTNVRVVLNPDKKDMKLYQQKTVVEEVTDPETEITVADAKAISRRHKLGGVVEFEIKTDKFSRLAAQAGKQVIIQAIREAERMIVTKEYEDKKEEIITAVVYKVDETDGSLVLDTGTSKAVLPRSEQIPGDDFGVGDRLKVFITEVRSGESRGPIVSLSRVHPGLVRRLFELQIPEIQDGTVVIKNISRDAGSRTKISVFSTKDDVDAVGACIGNHGMRISAILAELGNEKIDIIRYDEDVATYVKEALSPATVISVDFDGERTCRVKVAPDQLSLAIGKEGQNAKLAAKLTGCKIDIKA
jgi:N utilization substance protein A